ncbi:MAG TPA: tRNA guanosine(34) transglycosylase Tgt [Anaerolineales bacterium]|nr:tRNA guanosine(34) transglycosylase Tgt [Anaerolineales bacterium]
MIQPRQENPTPSPNSFEFDLEARDGRARAGTFHTPHGDIETPVFAPVGTAATVKAVTPDQLEALGASLVLANTYHLYLRPGEDVVDELGGLHRFMAWDRPILTDSGGFQVFSLSNINSIDDDGVTFKSHVDGSTHRFTPEKSIRIQEALGADIIMAFDECPEPYDRGGVESAVDRTSAWLARGLAAKTRSDQSLFGIVQGGVHADLRERSARAVTGFGLPGYAVGGLAVGEKKPEMHTVLDWMDDLLPADKPRYLMGVGTPQDLVNGVLRGVDIFDCVLPTRMARNHTAMLRSGGRLNLKNAPFARDPAPIDPDCGCSTCRTFTRSYLRHLINAGEMLSATLLSIHNLHTLVSLSREMRRAILDGTFEEFARDFIAAEAAI